MTVLLREELKQAYRLGIHLKFIAPAYVHVMGKVLLSEFSEAELGRLYPDEELKPLTRKIISTITRVIKDISV